MKAARQLNSLQRIAKYPSQRTKNVVFNSFIMSNFSYCPLVWHICSVKNTKKVEKIQERGLRIVWNDYQSDYKTLLEISGRELMYISRLKKLACFVYKCFNNTGPGLTNDLFNKKEIKYDLRDGSRVEQPLCSMTRYGLNSIAYQGASLWNSLPHDLKDCIDFKSFQSMIQSWNGPVCHCGFCVLCKF